MSALPYFGDAYMADTRHLTLEEHGAYHLLLLIAWRSPNCALPNDDKRIAQMLGITAKKWATLKPTIMAFWTQTKNGWEQKRLTKERQWVDEKSRKNRAAAQASHKARSYDHLSTNSFPPGAKSSDHNRDGAEEFETAKPLENNEPDNANASANGHANAHANGYAPPPLPLEPNGSITSSNDDSPSDDEPTLRPEHVFEFYQQLAQTIGRPVPRDFTPERRQLTKGRIAQYPLDDFKAVFGKCRDSPFLRGDRGRTPLTFDWLMKKANFQKVLEGNYDG